MLKQNKSTHEGLGEGILGTGISTIWKLKFTILQNGMVSYTYKIAFFHLTVWLNGLGGWMFSSRPGFDS